MTKEIYGIYDAKTRNFGDICILDRDEEFRDGCIDLFSNPDIPKYVINDLVGVNYGYITFDSGDAHPVFHIHESPRIIITGCTPMVGCRRHIREKEDSCDEEVEKDS